MGTTTLTAGTEAWQVRLQKLGAWLRRSWRERAVRRALAVEQTLVVGKGTVALVSIDGERVLVGVTQGCIRFQTLSRKTHAPDLADELEEGLDQE